MNKNRIKGYVAVLLFVLVFSVLAFVIPFSRTEVFWVAYAFGLLAFLLQIYVFTISFAKGNEVRSKFYGFPIARIGILYLAVQVILSYVEMALNDVMNTWVAVAVNVIVLAIAMIGCIAADAMREEIVRQDKQLEKNVSNMRELQSMTATLAGLCSDAELKKSLQKMADEFRFSDPVSAEETIGLEKELKQQVDEMQQALLEEDMEAVKKMCNKVSADLAERNRICALNK